MPTGYCTTPFMFSTIYSIAIEQKEVNLQKPVFPQFHKHSVRFSAEYEHKLDFFGTFQTGRGITIFVKAVRSTLAKHQ